MSQKRETLSNSVITEIITQFPYFCIEFCCLTLKCVLQAAVLNVEFLTSRALWEDMGGYFKIHSMVHKNGSLRTGLQVIYSLYLFLGPLQCKYLLLPTSPPDKDLLQCRLHKDRLRSLNCESK